MIDAGITGSGWRAIAGGWGANAELICP